MADEQMDPSMIAFKSFIKDHPGLIHEVRQGRQSWNALYQDWVILGNDDVEWQQYRGADRSNQGAEQDADAANTTSNSENSNQNNLTNLLDSNPTVSSVVQRLGQMNVNDLQGYLSQFSGVMGNVQQLMGQFQNTPGPSQSSTRDNPFSFRGF